MPNNSTFSPQRVIPILALALCLVVAYLMYYRTQRRAIMTLIERVNAAEFAAYHAVPTIDTAFFDDCFTPQAPNRREIYDILAGARKKDHRLIVPPSYRELQGISVAPMLGRSARATTTEQWLTVWHDASTDEPRVKYDNVNRQQYRLKRSDGRWLIEENIYAGKKETL